MAVFRLNPLHASGTRTRKRIYSVDMYGIPDAQETTVNQNQDNRSRNVTPALHGLWAPASGTWSYTYTVSTDYDAGEAPYTYYTRDLNIDSSASGPIFDPLSLMKVSPEVTGTGVIAVPITAENGGGPMWLMPREGGNQ